MLKFTGNGKDGTTYFLGLARRNVDRLTAGQPIKVNLADLGGPPINVVILFGETERTLFDDLKAGGLIPVEIEYREAEVGTAEVQRILREKGNL